MRRIGITSVLLAAAVLAVSPASARTDRDARSDTLRRFWDQGHWSDQALPKALRATERPERWELLVDLEQDGQWEHQGLFEEIHRRHLESPQALGEDLKSSFASPEPILLIGEVRVADGDHLYVVGAVLEQDSSLQDSEGRTLNSFVPLYVNRSYQDTRRFAQTYEENYKDSFGAGEAVSPPSNAAPETFEKLSACENACRNERNANLAYCISDRSSCNAAAANFRTACMVSCGGNPICQTGCDAIFLVSFALCASTYGDCEVAALYVVYGQCLDNCPLGGGGGCAAADHTATTALSLEETALGQKAASAPVHFALERAEKRGDESFVMDEWAVVQDGRIKASSNPAFARAVTGQQTMPAQGSFLMIQEPVHPMNSRHVPKPEVSVSSTVLSPSQRGRGEVVAARIEISPAGIVDRVEVVYTSKPLDKGRLEKLVSQRVGVVFASEKGHRTAVYVAFRLTDRLEILSTAAVFPKCC